MEERLKIALKESLIEVSNNITTTGNIDFLLHNIKSDFIIEMLAKNMLENREYYSKFF